MMELENILDYFKELIYISDIDSYELLFVNDALKRSFGISNYKH